MHRAAKQVVDMKIKRAKQLFGRGTSITERIILQNLQFSVLTGHIFYFF